MKYLSLGTLQAEVSWTTTTTTTTATILFCQIK